MNLRDLKLRARALLARGRVERELDDELAFHIEREAQKHLANGLSPAEARVRAKARFGSVTVAADECRDARGTAFVDNLLRDILYAWRSFRRAPLVALTIVATVGLGLGLVTVVFTILNAFVFLADEVRNPHEMYAVSRPPASPNAEPGGFTRTQFEALVRETGVFADAFAAGPDIDRWIEGRRMEGALVTGNFFHVLGVSAARGRTITPADDEAGRQAIVLSHRAWERHFASDPGVVSRPVLVNGVPFQVIGVMPERFRGLSVAAPDFWAPLSLDAQFRRAAADGRGPLLSVVGRLKPAVSRGQALSALQMWDSRRRAADVATTSDRPVRSLVLEPKPGTVPLSADAMMLFMPLFFAFGLILLIGCANVANLLLARAVVRQREIGIRLAIGASRRRIIRQLLTESLLLALVSAALGFGISRLALQTVVYAVTSTWPPDIGDVRIDVPPADWHVALFLLGGATLSTLFFALVPALQATRFELVRAMRGEVVRDARPGRARNALLALQVTASVLLLICSAVFLRSAMAAADVDPGIRTADVVTMEIQNETLRGVALDVTRRDTSVASIAASWPGGLGGRPAFAESLAAPGTSTPMGTATPNGAVSASGPSRPIGATTSTGTTTPGEASAPSTAAATRGPSKAAGESTPMGAAPATGPSRPIGATTSTGTTTLGEASAPSTAEATRGPSKAAGESTPMGAAPATGTMASAGNSLSGGNSGALAGSATPAGNATSAGHSTQTGNPAATGMAPSTGKSAVTYQFVSPEYFDVLGIDIVRGRGFAQTERNAAAGVAIVSESVARQMWPGREAVGQVLRLEPDTSLAAGEQSQKDDPVLLSQSVVVIGVTRDVAGFRLGGMRLAAAGVYIPIGAEAARTTLLMRVRGDAERARRVLAERLEVAAPNMATVSTLRTLATMEAFLLGIPFWLTLVLGALALVLTLSGLFSVLSYLVEQRTREIGIRMALGATSRGIGALVLLQSARPIVIGVLLGGALTASLGLALLATPAAEQIGATVRLFDPIAYAISLLCIIIACACAALIPARRAGRIDPVTALRQD